MALHRGEVVTRTQLYEHLFDENDEDAFPTCSTSMSPTSAKNLARNSSPRGAATAIASNENFQLHQMAVANLVWIFPRHRAYGIYRRFLSIGKRQAIQQHDRELSDHVEQIIDSMKRPPPPRDSERASA